MLVEHALLLNSLRNRPLIVNNHLTLLHSLWTDNLGSVMLVTPTSAKTDWNLHLFLHDELVHNLLASSRDNHSTSRNVGTYNHALLFNCLRDRHLFVNNPFTLLLQQMRFLL